ncbi:MAG: hypothetical protein LQ352_005311 [Teloschistes flavicans]|nr:MAG: hypothetical protein LQ352_005311 [Teloschistes flavicans]
MDETIRAPSGSPQHLQNLPNNLRYKKTKPKEATSNSNGADKESADTTTRTKSPAKKTNANQMSEVDKENIHANTKANARAPKPPKIPEAQ